MKLMETVKPERHNTRLLRIAKQTVRLPFKLATACCVWLFRRCRSPEQLREADQKRQSRVRRQLRGLPADHIEQPVKS